MKKLLGIVLAVGTTALLYACGGSDNDQPLVAANNTVLTANSTTVPAVLAVPFVFPAGVTEFGTNASTTMTFTSTSTAPAFKVENVAGTASGTTTFGSCVFAITASTFPTGSRMATGNTITVNPCNINVATKGLPANGVATTRAVALVLGAAISAGQQLTMNVDAGGQLTINGRSVGTVTLAPADQVTGTGSL